MLKNTFSYDKETGKSMWNEKRRKDIGVLIAENRRENDDEVNFDLPEQHGIARLPEYA
jgi:hypothetical protein